MVRVNSREVGTNMINILEAASSAAKDGANKAADLLAIVGEKSQQGATAVVNKAQKNAVLVATEAQKAAAVAAEAAKQARTDLRVAYYKPVKPEDYRSPDFSLPNLIVISDADERKGIDVCKGAIGWLSTQKGVDVLHLYDEFVDQSGLIFYKFPQQGGIYYRDQVERNRFVDLSDYMNIAQSDRNTELKDIARKLGAKRCTLEMHEEKKLVISANGKANSGATAPKHVKADCGGKANLHFTTNSDSTTLLEQTFEGSAEPQRPKLHWFAQDKEILSLIDGRFQESGARITSYHAHWNKGVMATFNLAAAEKLDAALKDLKVTQNFSIAGEVQREQRCSFDFYVEF